MRFDRPTPLRKEVYDYLRELLISGRLKAGEFVNQAELMAKLDVSRTPLRDSLMQLEAEGFVSIIPCKGVVVNPLTRDVIRNIYQISGALEAAAFEMVFPMVGELELKRMEEIIERTEALIAEGDYSRCHENNLAFHEVALNLCDNAELLRILRSNRERLYHFPIWATRELSSESADLSLWEREYWVQHRRLLALFARGTAREVADYVRYVHWAFEEVERPIISFYCLDEGTGEQNAEAAEIKALIRT